VTIHYCGRFAPSPTGPLHFGSLVAAVGSWLDAYAHDGRWLLRIEDIDTPRNQPGAAQVILRQLEAFGFSWHGVEIYQSKRLSVYDSTFDYIRQRGLAYGCACSRRDIANAVKVNQEGERPYPGICRQGLAPGVVPRAWRLRVEQAEIAFVDRLQGIYRQNLARNVGDFVLRRADEFYSYQLAVVADDIEQGVNHIVRGADLISSTPRQIFLYQRLGQPAPTYAHLPLAVNAAGNKLSKQTHAPELQLDNVSTQLLLALRFLGQPAPLSLKRSTPGDVWQWAKENWDFARIPQQVKIQAGS